MTNIVFATCAEFPALQPSDVVLGDALTTKGCSVRGVPWNGTAGDTKAFAKADTVIVRSCWDYQKNPAAFRQWMAAIAKHARLFNSRALMEWNMSKRYLLELAQAGAPMAATRLVDPDPKAIAATMDEMGLVRAVVKPEIGATASGLSIVERGDAAGLKQAAEKLSMPGLLQPVISEIKTEGETSLMFFGGVFSHAVRKRPRAGEIRCQAKFGGTAEPVTPSDRIVQAAGDILALLPEMPLYARVDGVILDERMQLMELELIEPELFFTYCPDGASRFAAALIERL